jgi:hypothetical protein
VNGGEQGNGGEGGIRTHGTLSRTPVFKTGAFNRSATSPALRAVFTGFVRFSPPSSELKSKNVDIEISDRIFVGFKLPLGFCGTRDFCSEKKDENG